MFLTFIIIATLIFVTALLSKINLSLEDHSKPPVRCIDCKECGFQNHKNRK